MWLRRLAAGRVLDASRFQSFLKRHASHQLFDFLLRFTGLRFPSRNLPCHLLPLRPDDRPDHRFILLRTALNTS